MSLTTKEDIKREETTTKGKQSATKKANQNGNCGFNFEPSLQIKVGSSLKRSLEGFGGVEGRTHKTNEGDSQKSKKSKRN